MGRILTNNTSLAVAIEESLGVLPAQPTWDLLEPNSVGAFGSTISTTARDPISRNRQRRKGTITDLDSAVDFDADLTGSHFDTFAEGFVFSEFLGEVERPTSDVTATTATILTGTVLPAGTLVRGRGFALDVNNGVHLVTASTATTIDAATLGLETPPARAFMEVVGYQFAAADLTVTVTNGETTLVSAASAWANVPLVVGAYIHVGDADDAFRFFPAPGVDSSGLARVTAVTAGVVTIDKLSQTFTDATTTAGTVRVFYGPFLGNVATDDANFEERSFQFELEKPGLATNGTASMFSYSKGNFCNTMAITAPLADKATVAFAFIGTDTAPPVDAASRATNADAALEPLKTVAYNTTTDCARMRIANVDGTGLSTDFKSLSVTLNNNVSPEKVLCNLGAKYMNYGNFEVNIEAQLVFTEAEVVDAIRDNRTVSMELALTNDDGVIVLDIPSMTIGGGGIEFPVNESVLINVTSEAFQDPTTGNSIGITKLAFIPEM